MLCNVRQPLKYAQDLYIRVTWAKFLLVPVFAPRFFPPLQPQKSARTSMPFGESHLCNQPGDLNLTQRVFLQVFRFFSLSKLTPSLLERCTSHGSLTLADFKLGNIIQNLRTVRRNTSRCKHNTFCIKFSNLINLVEDKM